MFSQSFWTAPAAWLFIAFAAGYLLGSIPFGLLFTRLAGLRDIRTIGSGNIGATNVLRTGNKVLAAATLTGDFGKGAAAVLIAAGWGPGMALTAGLGAVLGHLFPVWLKFQGGKGVATYTGVLAGIFWPAALLFCGVWILAAFLTRYASLASLAAAAVTPFALMIDRQWEAAGVFAILTALVYLRHDENIRRLARGEESKIGEHKG